VKNIRRTLLTIIIYSALLFYLIGLIWAGVLSLKAVGGEKVALPDYINILVLTLG
jgi:hypothetical protein